MIFQLKAGLIVQLAGLALEPVLLHDVPVHVHTVDEVGDDRF